MSNLSETVLTSDATLVWFAKIAGAVAGSAVSLAYMLPNGKREAAIRFAVGIICGMVFGGAAGVKIAETLSLQALLGRAELMLMGSTAASLAAWSALGVLKRLAERVKQAPLPGFPFSERNGNEKS
ncbi:putative membrane protein [Ochrobactrum quorumnocens]|uniref:Putative membrane protein n=1 Tax=Ochrobactrum quorumnocens TaxID=271865 RepID=A0A248UM19_9HYPH|nr:DUF6107 family protein [[Ochrobactrum] quorumnocens]ASV87676.1 putative membrane protein [[Ochrobactrum] quorumnocens]DAE53923.1 MAG TPA: hypothetical protein [Bacteriophage sp.]